MQEKVICERSNLVAFPHQNRDVFCTPLRRSIKVCLKPLSIGSYGSDRSFDIMRKRGDDSLVVFYRLALGCSGTHNLLTHTVEGPGKSAKIIRTLIIKVSVEVTLCDLRSIGLHLVERPQNLYIYIQKYHRHEKYGDDTHNCSLDADSTFKR